MHEIDAHSLKVLEFSKVREIIAGLTLSPYGKRYAQELSPRFDRSEIETLLLQSAQMRDIIRFEEAMPLERIEDIRELIDKSRVDGIHLEPKSLLQVKTTLDIINSLHTYGKSGDRSERFPDIVAILSRFHPRREITKAIGKAIDQAGDVVNSASKTLARIRRELGEAESRLKQHLAKILGSRQKHSGWQDDVITVRDGRYVIPFLTGDFKASEGIVHDKSNSGSTLFVEPSSAIPINNKLRQLQQDEKLEIDRILRELTSMVGEAADDIIADLNTFGHIDLAHARGTFALKIDAASPQIADKGELNLLEARHPLLIYAAESTENVIPLSIQLNADNQGILVTGPNTGGKTVALKAIGLLALMAMSGIEIPADHKSTIGIYRKIYADIGDEQSLELSLSTFSSHIRNIIAAVNDADDNTLALFDEIGAGTDPKEGAALAEIIVLTLLERGCNLVATTHYSQLKTLPLELPGLINASLEFDREDLQPTFKLKLGIPGASYAIDIARRLGLPDVMADRAARLLGSDERSLDNLIEKLDTDLKNLHGGRQELDDRIVRAKKLEEFYRVQNEVLDNKEKELTRKFADKYDAQLAEARLEIDRLVKELRESQASPDKVKETHQRLENHTKKAAGIRKSATPKKVADGRVLSKGDRVRIDKLGAEGEVVEMIGNKKVKVIIGSAYMVVDTIDITRKETPPPDKKRKRPGKVGKVKAAAAEGGFNPEIMLRGMTVDEALENLDKFLDDAVIAGVGQIYIVHGKGTGTLRRHLSSYLKSHRSIDSIRIGDWNEGGHGVTIARLKN
ncbi:MAG: endonuclease MutS2 [FCB group bacterium]|nr:endonuclease MutS2 [FCB group bacterium]